MARACSARKRGVATDGGSFTRSRAPYTAVARPVAPSSTGRVTAGFGMTSLASANDSTLDARLSER